MYFFNLNELIFFSKKKINYFTNGFNVKSCSCFFIFLPKFIFLKLFLMPHTLETRLHSCGGEYLGTKNISLKS